jgi:hypothetical protein
MADFELRIADWKKTRRVAMRKLQSAIRNRFSVIVIRVDS